MCYLPITCLKGIILIGSVFTIGVSIGLLIVAIVANNEKKDIIDNSDEKFVNDSLIAMYIFSIVFLFLGLCGLYGACKTRKKHNKTGNCLLGAYFIGVIVFLLIFAGACIFFFVAPQSIIGDSCEQGSKTELIEDLYKTDQTATNAFCHEECPCYVENQTSDLGKYLLAHNYSVNVVNSTNKNYQACINEKEADESSVLLLGTLEELLNCGGWCQKEDHYKYFSKYSDINHCVTDECLKNRNSCYVEFKSFLQSKGTLFGLGSLLATLICLVNVITICCLCYHPGKERGLKNFYSRMLNENN